tara:strand:+ start:303 stop:1133 length:831 start_codon:yes stop_codon:yes gene_type:complete
MQSITVKKSYAQLQDITLHYLDTGFAGEVIICIHGLWGRSETWKGFMQKYGGRYRVIALDLRGHGYSDKPLDKPYTGSVLADDIAAFMDHLNIETANLVGHSQGGRVAAYLAHRHPDKVKKLAILDMSAEGQALGTPVDKDKAHKDPLTHAWPLPFDSLERARSFLRDTFNNPFSFDHFMLSLTESEDGYDMLFSQEAIGSLKAHETEWYHILPDIQCPVLLMRTSAHDAVPTPSWIKMIKMIEKCIAVEMSHPDHNVHHTNYGEFYGHIDTFLEL